MEVSLALRDESQIAGRRRSRLRDSIVVVQITVCLVLLISAGLCVRSLFNARSIDPGFSTHQVALAQLDPASLGYSKVQQKQFYEQLLERVKALPAIGSASLADSLPLGTNRSVHSIYIDGIAQSLDKDGIGVQTSSVAPGYFASSQGAILWSKIAIRMRRGR